MTISERIAQELGVNTRQVEAAVKLLDEGATVPVISRYRKEATEGLDDTQLLCNTPGNRHRMETTRVVIGMLKVTHDTGNALPE